MGRSDRGSAGESDGDAAPSARTTSYILARRIVVSIVGATVLALGVMLLFVPGPGILVSMMGLGVLALEFAWARRWLRQLKRKAAEVGRAVR